MGPDQIPYFGLSDLDLHYLLRSDCPNTKCKYGYGCPKKRNYSEVQEGVFDCPT